MLCIHCKNSIPDQSVFCPFCGEGLPQQPGPQPMYQQPIPQQPGVQPMYQQPAPQQPMYQQPIYQEPSPQVNGGDLLSEDEINVFMYLCVRLSEAMESMEKADKEIHDLNKELAGIKKPFFKTPYILLNIFALVFGGSIWGTFDGINQRHTFPDGPNFFVIGLLIFIGTLIVANGLATLWFCLRMKKVKAQIKEHKEQCESRIKMLNAERLRVIEKVKPVINLVPGPYRSYPAITLFASAFTQRTVNTMYAATNMYDNSGINVGPVPELASIEYRPDQLKFMSFQAIDEKLL